MLFGGKLIEMLAEKRGYATDRVKESAFGQNILQNYKPVNRPDGSGSITANDVVSLHFLLMLTVTQKLKFG